MEEKFFRGPKWNEFSVPGDQSYAGTYIETAKIAEFLLTRLKPVDVETLDLNDRGCTLC